MKLDEINGYKMYGVMYGIMFGDYNMI